MDGEPNPPGGLRQLRVPGQTVDGEAAEGGGLGRDAVHGRVGSLGQPEGLHHVEPWQGRRRGVREEPNAAAGSFSAKNTFGSHL